MNIFSNKKIKTFLRFIYTEIVVLFIFLFIVILLSIFGIPEQARILVVESGSMEPAILTGSLIIDTTSSDYIIGDIITFNTVSDNLQPTTNVTHRIVDISIVNGQEVYQTKGDANNTIDAFSVYKSNILGKVVISIPYLGYLIGWGKTRVGFVIIVLIPTIVLIVGELIDIKKEINKLSNKKRLLLNE